MQVHRTEHLALHLLGEDHRVVVRLSCGVRREETGWTTAEDDRVSLELRAVTLPSRELGQEAPCPLPNHDRALISLWPQIRPVRKKCTSRVLMAGSSLGSKSPQALA